MATKKDSADSKDSDLQVEFVTIKDGPDPDPEHPELGSVIRALEVVIEGRQQAPEADHQLMLTSWEAEVLLSFIHWHADHWVALAAALGLDPDATPSQCVSMAILLRAMVPAAPTVTH